ncbi:MAG: hypothetical protein P4L48_11275 [Mycobacterium sp.]|nr:hypothetical protein [Mycobacterium sp.]
MKQGRPDGRLHAILRQAEQAIKPDDFLFGEGVVAGEQLRRTSRALIAPDGFDKVGEQVRSRRTGCIPVDVGQSGQLVPVVGRKPAYGRQRPEREGVGDLADRFTPSPGRDSADKV